MADVEPTVLVVDDEPDIHTVTKMALKTMRFNEKRVRLESAYSAKEAIEVLRAKPEIGAILLDVVMETPHAGLDAVHSIRGELGNRLVRIILRTGQPGAAPEKDVIDQYDIDGYLSKADLTSTKLYSTVRTALKAHAELVSLERHQRALRFLHESVSALHSYQPLETILQRVLQTAVGIFPTTLAVLKLDSVEANGSPRTHLLQIGDGPGEADALALRVGGRPLPSSDVEDFEGGVFVPFHLHRNLGQGWIWLKGGPADAIARQVLPVLALHAENALYSGIAQTNLEAREGEFFESISI